ncbi:hypothetical protein [Archangium sp.]|uniref:hypothetical protein n=1 Tax=Archangium sp. TaxID=1872627 RepID=UPI002D62893A|nr:hypothetical protein [Archangium sp.]HYO55911.1 hypothetical protein [Archangium sp.]
MGRLGPLRYLYVGSVNVEKDLAFHQEVLGGEQVWRFRKFGADVAAVRHQEGPLVLLADHRPAGSVLPLYAVEDLEALRAALVGGGLRVGHTVATPDGPCLLVENASGFAFGALEEQRPRALEAAYADPRNEAAVRESKK